VGTTFVLASEGVIPLTGSETTADLQLNIGLTPVRVTAHNGKPDFVWMEQRPAKFEEAGEPAAGVLELIVPLKSLDAIRRAHPNPTALQRILPPDTCAYLFTREAQDPAHQIHARMFNANPLDLLEDAATGSAAGPLGAYLVRHNILPPGKFVIEQGYEMGRPSVIHVGVTEAGPISVGGQTVKVGEGVMYLP
jgi:trans-2,3-dihydro-3-hydroxyanthranilate isomerase